MKMSVQPSLSKSKNATPGPIVSGSQRSADMAFSCTQVMPLAEAGISSKTGELANARGPMEGRPAAAPARPSSRTNSRREGRTRDGNRRMELLLIR
jgi:hypothetical protein